MRPLVIACLLLAGLVLAPTASAKELAGATICGAEDCRTVGEAQLRGVVPEGEPAVSPEEPTAFLRVSLQFRGDRDEIHTMESLLIPSRGLLGGEQWVRLEPAAAAALSGFAEGLDPWPASELSAAVVELGGTPIEAPQPAEPAPPAPPDRTSGAGVVLGGLAVIVLMGGLAAMASVRQRRPGGPVTG
jgi:hypothetical protein